MRNAFAVFRAIGVIYNLPEIVYSGRTRINNRSLVLSTQSLVGIYNGTIKDWDHPLLREENPEIQLPPKKIRVAARSDSAGDTDIFTHALSEFDHLWAITYGESFSDPGKSQFGGFRLFCWRVYSSDFMVLRPGIITLLCPTCTFFLKKSWF